MNNLQNSVAITILGKEYRVRTGGDIEYVQGLSRYINQKVIDVQASGAATSTMELVTLVLLGLADDLASTQAELKSYKDMVDSRLKKLAEAIDGEVIK